MSQLQTTSMATWVEKPDAAEIVLTNAKLVTGAATFTGTMVLHAGKIAEIDTSRSRLPNAIDLAGDYLLPGLIDIHTDNLEKHVIPRPGVRWDAMDAALIHDAMIAASGITTVFDSLVLGSVGNPLRCELLPSMVEGLRRAEEAGGLRADHRLHLRCDLLEPELGKLLGSHVEQFGYPEFITLLDDSPLRDVDRFKDLCRRRGWADNDIEKAVDRTNLVGDCSRQNRAMVLEFASRHKIPVANHDDTKAVHVDEGGIAGLKLSEFPTTLEAAQAARINGMSVIVGAPNLVKGGSHVGNVSVEDLVRRNLADIFCSDYIPASLLKALWMLTQDPIGLRLDQAVSMASSAPAQALGLPDRGELKAGLRADLVHVAEYANAPIIRSVWVNGLRRS